jgi:hypothetical protein
MNCENRITEEGFQFCHGIESDRIIEGQIVMTLDDHSLDFLAVTVNFTFVKTHFRIPGTRTSVASSLNKHAENIKGDA